MCGIAGILGRLDDAHRAALERMGNAMSHRGPDGGGFWTSQGDERGWGCMLAHRRLSILDLSTAANQPMIDPTGGQAIAFNGEIYNYVELRQQMEAAGQTFASTGDTAVMLRALAIDGHRAVEKLRGMFAFALWDPRSLRVTLARDPLGIKPLYLYRNPDSSGDWSLIWASEVRALLASGLIKNPKLNPAAVASVVWNGFVPGPGTIVQGIESIWPGQVLVFDARGEKKIDEFYWTMPRGDGSATEESVGDALRESVKLHLASDVPLGVFLSGGVDSASVANLAQQVSETPIVTFTLAFEEQDLNEGPLAREIAKQIGTDHREVVLTESRFTQNLEKALESLDQPTFDGLNSFYMSHAVREAGLTVALVGTGGDELFGGYKSFRDLPSLRKWRKRAAFLPNSMKVAGAKVVARAMSGAPGRVKPQTRWAKLPDMIRHHGAHPEGRELLRLYQLAYALFVPEFQAELLNDQTIGADVIDGIPAALHARLLRETAGRSTLSATSVLEQRLFLGERLMRDSDAASMAASLELRLPLTDQVLTEHVSRLPDDARYQPIGRKQMLRRIGLKGIDPTIFNRPKTGFVLPYDHWIRQTLGKSMNDAMRDEKMAAAVGLNGAAVANLWQAYQERAPGMYWSRVWALYVLMRWCHRHGVTM